MTQDETNKTSATEGKPRTTSALARIVYFFLFLALLGAVAAAAFIGHAWLSRQGGISQTVAVQEQEASEAVASGNDRVRALEENVKRVQQRLDELTSRLVKLEESLPQGANESGGINLSEDFSRLRNDMLSLSNALSSMQSQVKHASQSAEQTRVSGQTKMALAIAFTQFKIAEASGEPFVQELGSIKKADAQDGLITSFLVPLEPLAATGAPTMSRLREDFLNLSGGARTALLHANATTWQERLIADLKSLISIRPLNALGGPDDVLSAIDRDLSNNKLKEALDKLYSQPETVQAILKDWRAKAESRLTLDQAVKSLADQLINLEQITPTTDQGARENGATGAMP